MALSVPTSLDVIYDGYFGSETRGEILKEFVKYILYQRSQIPMYFDQIRELLQRQSDSAMHMQETKVKRTTTADDQKRLVHSVNTLCQIIQDVFSSSETVKQVLIVLGSSIVSPKDTYLVSFPTEFYEGRILSRQACISHLFKTLYTADFLGSSKSISTCTNLFMLFLAPRCCNHQQWNLTPRLSYKVPTVGTHYAVNVVFNGSNVVQTSSGLNLAGDDLDISGIRPLDCSAVNDCMTIESCTPIKGESSFMVDQDYVWFELPVVIKGYKDKLP